MTRIDYIQYGNVYTLQLQGHATGSEAVCAGLSAITYSIAQTMLQLEQEGQLERVNVLLGDGNALVDVTAKETFCEQVAMCYLTAINGMQLMAATYPGIVSYQQKVWGRNEVPHKI